MLDIYMRQVKDTASKPLVLRVRRIPPILFTFTGLIFGLMAVALLAYQFYMPAFILWFLNRLFDALDGGVARLEKIQSDLGGYLDILADFVVYSLIPVGIILGRPSSTGYLVLALLLSTFYVNAASWMYLAAILEKRNAGRQTSREQTAITMPHGLVGGTMTIIFFTAFIFFPAWHIQLFIMMAALVVVTILQRLIWAVNHL